LETVKIVPPDKPYHQCEQYHRLLHTINDVAAVLFAAKEGENFEAALLQGMERIGRCLEVDRIQIWRNETRDGLLYFVRAYQWLSDVGRKKSPVLGRLQFSYRDTPEWENKFLSGEYINGPLSQLPRDDQEFLRPSGIQSVAIIPLFLYEKFYGLFSIADYRQERTFNEDEIDILHSISLMMASALIRNKQSAKIHEAPERAWNLLDAVPLMVSLWDKRSTLVACNEEYVNVFKVRDKREILEHFLDFSPECQPDGQLSSKQLVVYVQKAFEEGRCVLQWMHQLLDGTPIPMEVTLVRVEYEDGCFVAGYARDLRGRRRMIEEIAQRDKLLSTVNRVAAILFQSGIAEFEGDLHRCMGMMGKAVGADRVSVWKNHIKDNRLYCTQIYEWSDNAESQTDKEITIDTPYGKDMPDWAKILLQGKCINDLICNLLPKEQILLRQRGILSLSVVPVFVSGKFWGFVGFVNCRSEWAFTENEELILRSGSLMIANALQRNDNITEMLRLQEELEDALEVAQKASYAKSNFLAHMSHEMRTPLNAIIGLSELTLNSGELKGEDCFNLEKIYNAGMTLLSTVNDVLDLSKIKADKFELLPAEYDVPSLLNDTITQSMLHIGEKPISFSLNIDENLPTRLYGDELRIKQVFNNLLSNAFKYTREGTVELDVSHTREGDVVWLIARVRDTGMGIRPEDMSKLFFDYAQFDSQSHRAVAGTGLGLPIVKRIVEMMDGSITVESEYGKGSVFTVRFPQEFVTDAPIGLNVVQGLKNFHYFDQKRHRNSRMVRTRLPYARVLVVDDVLTNLDVTKGMMKPYGMQIDCVTSGQQAIDAIRTEDVRYNVVFMDHMMPEMDGIEAVRIIREEIGSEYAKSVPIIALTANAIMGNEEMFLRKGFQAFIPKPIELARLDAVIRKWVRDKDLEKSLTNRHVCVGNQMFMDIRSGQERRVFATRRSGADRRMHNESIPGLHISKGIERFGDDEESYLQALCSYAASTRQLLETVREVNRENLADYAITVHGIKGSSRSIAADLVGDQAESLEKAAKVGDVDFVMANNVAFIDAVEALIRGLDELFRQMSSENPKPKKDRPDEDALSRLLSACENYDMDGMDAAMSEIEGSEYEADDGLTAWLRANVDLMNVAQIKEKLLSVLK